ncbi:MAG TPA: ribonuclease J [Chloroflexia bacterium]|nr:ribonuclease J [Chloroflexia bacterium]
MAVQLQPDYIDPQPTTERIRFIPIGGLGEVGKNMSVVEYGEDIIIIDVGMGFPEEEMFGVDLVLPDISYLDGKKDRIRGICITHGHEDHIGGLPWLLPQLDAPIYGTPLTLGLISNKLKERGLLQQAELNTVQAGDVITLGAFRVEFVHMCHSIPDACLLAIHTPLGTIIHTGDFKLDPTPVDDQLSDYEALARLGREGVLGLFTDCVHVETPGYTPSERVVGRNLDPIIANAPGRVIIATFASLISRVQQIMDIGYKYNRRVALLGRSLHNNVQVAAELGYLNVPPGLLIEVAETSKLYDNEVLVICTGAQGEPTSALSRIANDDSRHWNVKEGDIYILSATPIPGNETSVGRVINNLFSQGAEVIYSAVAPVHVSGHASQEEHRLMLNLLRPKYVVPIHGERRHLITYQKLAQSVGMPKDNILLVDNGYVVELDEDEITVTGRVPATNVFVDGVSVGDIGQVVIRDRQLLARDGVLLVVVTVDKQSGELVAGPDIVTRGFVYAAEAGALLDETKERIRAAVDGLNRHATMAPDWNYLNKKIRDAASQYLYEQTRRRPMVLPVVVEV